jgi:hypothetical protein
MTEPTCLRERRSLVRTPWMLGAVAMLAATAVSGCSSSSSDVTVKTSDTGSCAVVIEVAGSQYIGGRQSDSELPVTGRPIKAKRLDCDDSGPGHVRTTPIVATKIRGVSVVDAVAAQGYQLMLCERLWRVAWKDLPIGLQPHVAGDFLAATEYSHRGTSGSSFVQRQARNEEGFVIKSGP